MAVFFLLMPRGPPFVGITLGYAPTNHIRGGGGGGRGLRKSGTPKIGPNSRIPLECGLKKGTPKIENPQILGEPQTLRVEVFNPKSPNAI